MSITVTNYGVPLTVEIDSPDSLRTYLADMHATGVNGRDIRFLPLMLAAAQTAEADDYCYQYDRIASEIGSFSRDELRDAGLLVSKFQVEGTRTVTITVTMPFSHGDYEAARPAEVRENFDVSDLGDIDDYELRSAISNGNYEIESDEIDIDGVTRE